MKYLTLQKNFRFATFLFNPKFFLVNLFRFYTEPNLLNLKKKKLPPNELITLKKLKGLQSSSRLYFNEDTNKVPKKVGQDICINKYEDSGLYGITLGVASRDYWYTYMRKEYLPNTLDQNILFY